MELKSQTSSIRQRRRFTPEQKQRILEETTAPGASISEVARRYNIAPSQLYVWKRFMQEGGKTAIIVEEDVVGISEMRKLQMQIKELERQLGRKTLENEILKEAVSIAKKKKLISHIPLLPQDDIR